jgi:hypothetical protein
LGWGFGGGEWGGWKRVLRTDGRCQKKIYFTFDFWFGKKKIVKKTQLSKGCFVKMWPVYWHLKSVFLAPHILGPSKWHLKRTTKEEEGPGRRKKARARARGERQKREEATRSAHHRLSVLQQLRRHILMHRAMSRFVASVALCVLLSLACLQLHSKLSLSLSLYLFLSLRSRVSKRLNRSACVRVCFFFLILMSSGYVFVMHWGIPLQ